MTDFQSVRRSSSLRTRTNNAPIAQRIVHPASTRSIGVRVLLGVQNNAEIHLKCNAGWELFEYSVNI